MAVRLGFEGLDFRVRAWVLGLRSRACGFGV